MVLHRHPIQQLQDAHHLLPIQKFRYPGQPPSTTPSGGYRQEESAGVSVSRGVVDAWILGSQVRLQSTVQFNSISSFIFVCIY